MEMSMRRIPTIERAISSSRLDKDGRNISGHYAGADTAATLTAAYRFAELIGCYFNLAGDVIPDQKLAYPSRYQ